MRTTEIENSLDRLVNLSILSALAVAADVFALCVLSARPWERHQVLTLCLSIVAFTISGTYRWITICTTLDQRKQNRKRQKERRTNHCNALQRFFWLRGWCF